MKTKFVEKAKSYLNDNYEHFCKAFGVACTAWCAAFVAVVGRESGVDVPWSMSCTAQRTAWQNKGLWHTDRDIKVGDIVYYDWDASGDCDHVGICTEIDGDTLQITEGNYGNFDNNATRVSNRYIKSSYRFICGYARPKFDNVATSTKRTDKTVSVNIKQLSKGDESKAVRVLQSLLISEGYSCGTYGADGDFGEFTDKAVRKYQLAKGLDVDGIAGQQTWNSLLS